VNGIFVQSACGTKRSMVWIAYNDSGKSSEVSRKSIKTAVLREWITEMANISAQTTSHTDSIINVFVFCLHFLL